MESFVTIHQADFLSRLRANHEEVNTIAKDDGYLLIYYFEQAISIALVEL